MSAKWVRSQQWDDRHLTGALWPAKVVLRLFSWISTSVVLLTFVALYGVLASVPIGLLARIPTVLFIALVFVVLFVVGAVVPVWISGWAMRRKGVGRSVRFIVGTVALLALSAGVVVVWWWGVWPLLRYDPIAGTGVRFFGAFIEKYQAVQFRRLPMMEMSELEFYAWWPLRVVLLLFVTNLVVATIRRIEFTFPRIGVLTVHTGIVTIALGSVYYTSHKQEGDMILLASGGADATGKPMPPRAEKGFYDNTRTALWVTQDRTQGWDQRVLQDVPRYSDYNLNVVPRSEPTQSMTETLGPIDIPVPGRVAGGAIQLIDDDITFRIVGYASYAELVEEWLPATAAKIAGAPERVRMLDLVVTAQMPEGQTPPRKSWRLFPDHAAGRAEQNALGVEYTIAMPEVRWNALAMKLPPGTRHALLVEHSASGFKAVYGVSEQQVIAVGETGYTLSVKSLSPRPPMPLVTRGYEGATSSLAIVRVQPPADGSGGDKPGAFDRWVYSRFPEISQDMLDEMNDRGMPKRRDADPGIRITYIDASTLNVYFDERADGTVRAIVRQVGAEATVTENLKPGAEVQIAPVAAIKLGSRIDDAVRVEVPEVVPDEARDRQRIGNHEASAAAVEIRTKAGLAGVFWVPFSKYLTIGREEGGMARDVRLPDGRTVSIAFGRVWHEFWPKMAVRLHEFEMIPYEHSETPKDYRSDVAVTTDWPQPDAKQETDGSWTAIRRTSLNNPLLIVTPYVAPEGMPLPGRVLGRMMSWIAPNQYKFAQAGWDQSGWRESQQMVAAGRLAKPVARFTILGVGNNPGIYIIAAGAIMMSIGIPWAFYLKPWLIQRQKRKIQEQLARSGGKTASAAKLNGTASTHENERSTQGVKP